MKKFYKILKTVNISFLVYFGRNILFLVLLGISFKTFSQNNFSKTIASEDQVIIYVSEDATIFSNDSIFNLAQSKYIRTELTLNKNKADYNKKKKLSKKKQNDKKETNAIESNVEIKRNFAISKNLIKFYKNPISGLEFVKVTKHQQTSVQQNRYNSKAYLKYYSIIQKSLLSFIEILFSNKESKYYHNKSICHSVRPPPFLNNKIV